jgi:hypothetical protein
MDIVVSKVLFYFCDYVPFTLAFQVFKEAATYRRRLKDLTEKMFLRFYGDALGVNEDIESQVTYQDNIAHNVLRLIGRESLFHYRPQDALVCLSLCRELLLIQIQGKKHNMEHPGIAAICIDFYYVSSPGPLAKLFPADFSTIIPEHAVVAVMTCVSNCISFSVFGLNKTRSITASTSIALGYLSSPFSVTKIISKHMKDFFAWFL